MKQILTEVGRHLGPLLEDEYIIVDAFLPFLRSVMDDAVTAAEASLVDVIAILNSCITSSQVRDCSAALTGNFTDSPYGLFWHQPQLSSKILLFKYCALTSTVPAEPIDRHSLNPDVSNNS